MSRHFGPIRQNGYVVRDVEAAMKHWTEALGVGPFFYIERVPIPDFRFRGEPSPLEVSIALANSGPLQIELIQQRNDAPSMYRDFLASGDEGLQHVAFWPDDFDAAVARARAEGWSEGQAGEIGEHGRFVYFDTGGPRGAVVELSEVSGPKGRFFEHIAKVAADWDGSVPVHRIGS